MTCRFWTTTPGQPFPEDVDIILGGGGQDSGQSVIQDDLHANGDTLRSLAEAGVPMLVICGLYQLFGKEFRTREGGRCSRASTSSMRTRSAAMTD